jgi:hypothetical protein
MIIAVKNVEDAKGTQFEVPVLKFYVHHDRLYAFNDYFVYE